MKLYLIWFILCGGWILASCYIIPFLYHHSLWFSFFVCLLLILVALVRLYWIPLRALRLVNDMIRSLPYEDVQRYMSSKNFKMFDANSGLNSALSLFYEQMTRKETKLSYYEVLLDKIDMAVLVCRPDGVPEWTNRAARNMLGESFRPLKEWLVEKNISRVVVPGKGQTSEVLLSSTCMSIRGFKRYLLTFKNIGFVLERNETEAWNKLTRVLTHEIMNSLTPIISLSDTLCCRAEEESPSPKMYHLMKHGLQAIHRRGEGLMAFVENYRKLTRIPDPVCAVWEWQEIFSGIKDLYGNGSVQFKTEGSGCCVWADRYLLEQVLVNLIKNACEASVDKPDAQICVEAKQLPDGGAELKVEDHGIGILPDVQTRMFVPFFTTKPGGSGIGLSLCKQIMNLHGGRIGVWSEPDRGTVFTLYFPPEPETAHT